MHELVSGVDNPNAYKLSEGEFERRVAARFGPRSRSILEAFRRCYPEARPFDLLSLISVAFFRQSAVTQAARKAAQGVAPAYLYYFTYRTPVLDGRPGAFHSAEIAFVFDNLDRCVNLTGGDPQAGRLAAQISQAWIHFARTGNPNHPDLPDWPAFDPQRGQTMVFDTACTVQNDPDGPARRALASAC
jgi:para-nitrobenzyl esterase